MNIKILILLLLALFLVGCGGDDKPRPLLQSFPRDPSLNVGYVAMGNAVIHGYHSVYTIVRSNGSDLIGRKFTVRGLPMGVPPLSHAVLHVVFLGSEK